MKKREIIITALVLAVCLGGCANGQQEVSESPQKTDSTVETSEWETKAEIILGEQIQITGEGAEAKENRITIFDGGAYRIQGTLTDGRITLDTEEEVKLILDNASITSGDGPAVYGENVKALYIETVKDTENVLEDGTGYTDGKGAVFSNDPMILAGEGTLRVTGNNKHGICSDDTIKIESGTIEITSAVKDGIHAKEDLYIEGGTVRVLESGEGIEAKGAMYISGGQMEICASDDGINAGTDLQISGGEIYTDVSNGDGIDSNGTLTISGGLIVAMGAQMPESGIDCDDRKIVITGGTLIACGGTNSMPDEDSSTSVSLLLGGAKSGESVGILDADGNTVFAFKAEKTYSNMLLSMESLTKDASYTVYTGGSIENGTSFHGYYRDAGYSGGEVFQNGERLQKEMPQNGEPPQGFPQDGQMPQDGERPQGPPQDERAPQNTERPSA